MTRVVIHNHLRALDNDGQAERIAGARALYERPGTAGFDEHKLMLGFGNSREALMAFNKAYNNGVARRVGAVTHLSCDSLAFKNWIKSGNKYEPMAPELREAA